MISAFTTDVLLSGSFQKHWNFTVSGMIEACMDLSFENMRYN